jgi:hypothetical protein
VKRRAPREATPGIGDARRERIAVQWIAGNANRASGLRRPGGAAGDALISTFRRTHKQREAVFVRMEFSRMTGVFISQKPWPVDDRPAHQLVAEAKAALADFYDRDEYSMWPKKEYCANAPEHVRMVDSRGAIILEYDLTELVAESGCSLAAGKDF